MKYWNLRRTSGYISDYIIKILNRVAKFLFVCAFVWPDVFIVVDDVVSAGPAASSAAVSAAIQSRRQRGGTSDHAAASAGFYRPPRRTF